ncbi:hypothetical protein G3O08_15750 [Cryomorpha ignava]|uniref:Uncharacterized protein n=1 Tax=Cryomorpha ignava TaxID=101383 RepID=A0A7K3WWG7_9FLAO|nr:hypothetical protein [Cryomorpha ignava]NEN24955.1 hypothetical protein [Cryomorpha ignava]
MDYILVLFRKWKGQRIFGFLLLSMCALFSKAQLPTYTIDNNVNTNSVFKNFLAVTDFHFLNDGRILVGGGFDNEFARDLGMIDR